MTTISNHRAAQTDRVRRSPLRPNRVGHSPLRDPLREHSAKTFSQDTWQHERIELLPLNPDYDPIPVAPHEGPEMVVVAEWVSSLDSTLISK